MKKPTSPEQYTRLISEIEAACRGTAWEAEFRRGWDKDSIRFQISLTAEARSQQFENRGTHVYAPAIYFDDDLEGETTWGFRIQTTGLPWHGDLRHHDQRGSRSFQVKIPPGT